MARVTADESRAARRLVPVERGEALRLLSSVPFGRVVFTEGALPAIRPVNHLVDLDRIIVRTRLTAKVAGAVRADTVVAYEADQIDPATRTGWSVVVTGKARTVTDPQLVARYQRDLQPWVDLKSDTVIAIEPTFVTAFRMVPAEDE
ncbi:MAG TPA: pyridoxamine 5'-phosphate oxidase family protein [Micromonosporaceae bacterium]|nr:pyridoxamine 5'-phosphate oxidase family protein [Micromonosporaceae bacterium]